MASNPVSPCFEQIVLEVTPELSGERIDKVLATLEPIGSRSQALKLLQAGRVRIAGKVLKPSYVTRENDRIDIDIPVQEVSVLVPYEFPLVIPYEDEDVIIVDKPAGLVVHPAYGHAQDTLVNALLHHTKNLSMGFGEQRPGLVHRIDKGTSGLLVIARNEYAQRFLAMQFQRKTTHRLYRALIFGRPKEVEGTIRSYLRRHPEDRKRVASTPIPEDGSPPLGKNAVTHYRVTETHLTGISLIELRLETGRTHQIRVHLSESGHPIVGDSTYGGDSRVKSLRSVHLRDHVGSMERFALHAMELGFIHPKTKQRMTFTAPWPSDLMTLIEHCDFPRYKETHETIIGSVTDESEFAANSLPMADDSGDDEIE